MSALLCLDFIKTYHSLGDLPLRIFLSNGPGGWKVKTKVLAGDFLVGLLRGKKSLDMLGTRLSVYKYGCKVQTFRLQQQTLEMLARPVGVGRDALTLLPFLEAGLMVPDGWYQTGLLEG